MAATSKGVGRLRGLAGSVPRIVEKVNAPSYSDLRKVGADSAQQQRKTRGRKRQTEHENSWANREAERPKTSGDYKPDRSKNRLIQSRGLPHGLDILTASLPGGIAETTSRVVRKDLKRADTSRVPEKAG